VRVSRPALAPDDYSIKRTQQPDSLKLQHRTGLDHVPSVTGTLQLPTRFTDLTGEHGKQANILTAIAGMQTFSFFPLRGTLWFGVLWQNFKAGKRPGLNGCIANSNTGS
jgi:hypothetical protein